MKTLVETSVEGWWKRRLSGRRWRIQNGRQSCSSFVRTEWGQLPSHVWSL